MKPLISIIIPVYNVAPYIKSCLYSVLNQTYKNIEIIIINDKTTDESISIIKDVLQKETPLIPIRIIEHAENKGLSSARNTGIRNSKGDYLYFLDSDDEISTDCIETLSNRAISSCADLVIGDYIVQGSLDFYPPLELGTSVIKGNLNIIKAYMQEKFYVMAWNKLVKKEFIIKNSLYFKNDLIHEDCLWSFQCACKAEIIDVIKHTTYIYKIQKKSITSTLKFEKDFQMYKIILTEITNYANSLHLLNNKYVFSFIEEEKLRLLRKCKYAEHVEYIPVLYSLIRLLPHAKHYKILYWEIFNVQKLIRDAHYFFSPRFAENYYESVPEMQKKYTSKKRKVIGFYIHFIKLLIYNILNDRDKKL